MSFTLLSCVLLENPGYYVKQFTVANMQQPFTSYFLAALLMIFMLLNFSLCLISTSAVRLNQRNSFQVPKGFVRDYLHCSEDVRRTNPRYIIPNFCQWAGGSPFSLTLSREFLADEGDLSMVVHSYRKRAFGTC